MCKDAPNTGVGDRLGRLEQWTDVDVASAIIAGLDDTTALSGWVQVPWAHPYLVADAAAGASRVLIKDDKGVQLAVHGQAIEVCGNSIGVLPTPHDQTSQVRLYGATSRVAIGALVAPPRVVTKKTTAAGASGSSQCLLVHYRNREPGELFAVHCQPQSSGTLNIDEMRFAPLAGKSPSFTNIYTGAVVAGSATNVVCPQLQRGDGVLAIWCDQVCVLRVYGGLA